MSFLQKSSALAASLCLAFVMANGAEAQAEGRHRHHKKNPAAEEQKSATASAVAAHHRKVRETASSAESYLLIDTATGKVLDEKNADAIHYPASTTKILTAMCVWDAIQSGTLTLDTVITVSPHAASMGNTKLGLRAGGKITVRDALTALAVASSNDMAVALAEAVSGSETRFVQVMNSKAAALGMTHSRFVNASGWEDNRQITTARDLITLAIALMKQYPDLRPYFAKKDFTYAGVTYPNHNHLVSGEKGAKIYDGMDFGKTGYFRHAGSNLVASAQKGDARVLAVIMRAPSAATRDSQMRNLLDEGFDILTAAKVRTPGIEAPRP